MGRHRLAVAHGLTATAGDPRGLWSRAHRWAPRAVVRCPAVLVIHLDGPVPEGLVERLERCGGTRVRARDPYRGRWGVTVRDPGGYQLVLSARDWCSRVR